MSNNQQFNFSSGVINSYPSLISNCSGMIVPISNYHIDIRYEEPEHNTRCSYCNSYKSKYKQCKNCGAQ